MKRFFTLSFLIVALVLTAGPLSQAKITKAKSSVVTSLQDLIVLLDLSRSQQNKAKVYIDNENCQCVCDEEKWTCIKTECELQENACLDDELSYDKISWRANTTS